MRLYKSRTLRVLLTIALILAPYLSLPHIAGAAALTDVTDIIDDSRPTNDTSHEMYFVTDSGVGTSETITLTFDDSGDAFDLSSVAFGDVDIAEDDDGACDGAWSDKTLAATATASDWGVNVDTGTDVITLTAPSSGTPITAGRCVQIEIGTNASGGTNEINNPSAGVYDIDIAGTFGDTGTMKVVVIATITAQVTVDETLTFTITGQAPGDCVDYSTAGTEITTTAASVNFGSPAANAFIDGCQELDIDTNAAGGYTVTVQESDQLTYSGTPIPDGNCDGGCAEDTEAAWATNSNNGFGYCMDDFTGDGSATADAGWGTNGCGDGTTNFKIFAEKDVDSPDIETIMSSAGSTNDVSDIGYRLTVGGTQAAGVYTNNIIFVATPTY
jgi:hypothetical protein